MNNTPKEKAEELVNKYLLATPIPFHIEDAKKCALVSISDKIEELIWLNLLITTDNDIKEVMNKKVEELLQVEKEIKLL